MKSKINYAEHERRQYKKGGIHPTAVVGWTYERSDTAVVASSGEGWS